MKSSDEMLDSLFERREKYLAHKKAKMQKIGRAASVTACFCMAALVGIGVWYSNIGSQPDVIEPDVPVPNKNITVTDKIDTTNNTDENTTHTDETTINDEPQVPEDTTGEVPEGIGGGFSFLTDLDSYYPINITTIDKGVTDVEGCFVFDKKEEMNDIIYSLYDLIEYNDCTYHKMLWYVVQGLNLTRQEIEQYSDLSTSYKLTTEQIDALLIKDEIEASKALRSKFTLFSNANNRIYRIIDIESMSKKEFNELEFQKEDIRRLISLLEEYVYEQSNSDSYISYIKRITNKIREMSELSASTTE